MSQEIVSVYEKLKCPSSCSQQENNDLNFKNKELNSANNQNEQKMDSALLETGFFFPRASKKEGSLPALQF